MELAVPDPVLVLVAVAVWVALSVAVAVPDSDPVDVLEAVDEAVDVPLLLLDDVLEPSRER